MKNKKIIKKLLWAVAVIALIYGILNLAFLFFAKKITESQIEKTLKVKISIGKVTLSFPLSIALSRVEIEGLLKADSISFSPSILGFFAGKVVLNELKIIRPQITIVKDQDGHLNFPVFEQKGKQPPVLLASLKIKDGKVIFLDKKLDPQGYRVAVGNIEVNVAKTSFPPTSLFTRFKASADLLGASDTSAGKAQAEGWIDFGPKNMDGKFELINIEATTLAPYYQNIFSAKKLLSAKLNFSADLRAKDNDLAISCHSEFSNIIYDKSKEEETTQTVIDIFPKVMNIFSNATGNIAFDFTIHTKLDKPRIDLVNLKGSIGKAAVENLMNQPPEDMAEKVKSTVDEFKDLGKSLKDIFKKKKEE